MIDVLVEHPWFMVINKPTGLLTQAVPGVPSVQTVLCEQLASNQPNAPRPFVGIPHRLDRVTTGAMVVARNQRALKRLCEQFASRKVDKIYHAVVEGEVPVGEQVWRDWMRKIPDVARAELVSESDHDAREAVLRLKRIGCKTLPTGDVVSLVEVRLETGRMHQIRLQCSVRGHAVVGDSAYESRLAWGPSLPEQREPSIALHAREIHFHHPQSGERISVVADYPSDAPWTSVT